MVGTQHHHERTTDTDTRIPSRTHQLRRKRVKVSEREALEKYMDENQEVAPWKPKGQGFTGIWVHTGDVPSQTLTDEPNGNKAAGPPQGELEGFKRAVTEACETPAQKISDGIERISTLTSSERMTIRD